MKTIFSVRKTGKAFITSTLNVGALLELREPIFLFNQETFHLNKNTELRPSSIHFETILLNKTGQQLGEAMWKERYENSSLYQEMSKRQ